MSRLTPKFFLVLTLAFAAGYVFLDTEKTLALSGSDWKAGRIIDDPIFTDKNSMSVAQIQAFLNNKVGTGGYDSIPGQCDNNGLRKATPYSSLTRTEYGASRTPSNPKFTCLNNYYEVPKTSPGPGIPASNYGGAPIPAGAKSAAQLIWDAAQRHNISPKVLLVTIQKESAGPLTIDDWPFKKQFTYAMGAHCPDSGPGGSANCDENYAGFSIQISESAELMRWYLDNMHQPWWSYKKPGNNAVRYHPNTACGSSNVFIESMATAALYTYTPYQPNATALSNIYGGQSDGCSSYGNRNFWRIYHDWFGSPYVPARHATYAGQSGYPSLLPGQSANAFFRFKNTGAVAWHDPYTAPGGKGIINLATTNPINRASLFGSTWGSGKNRPGTVFSKVYESNGTTLASNQHIVLSNQIVQYNFKFTVPANTAPGTYREWFQPIHEGGSDWNLGAKVFLDVKVLKPYRQATYAGQSGYPTINRGQSANAFFRFKNTGTVAWHDAFTAPNGQGRINLASTNPINRASIFGSTWAGSKNRPSTTFAAVYESNGTTLASNQHIAMPGQIVQYNFTFTVPSNATPGTYREWFQPILEASPSWNIGGTVFLDVKVK